MDSQKDFKKQERVFYRSQKHKILRKIKIGHRKKQADLARGVPQIDLEYKY